jgi:putative DNA primase/helicase
MTQEELEQKYLKIPQEIKQTRRWICYKIENRDGKQTKVPYCAINGGYAKSNDPSTWTIFRVAISGCIKFHFDGIGFMLGEDKNTGVKYFGIDLDNHEDENGKKPMNQDDFFDFSSEFINSLQSYTEYSHSGEGIHIICKGTLPDGARRKAGVGVEMYDKGRFFTMSGKVILDLPIMDRTEEIKPLWEKYLNTQEEEIPVGFNGIVFGENRQSRTVEINPTNLSDNELIDRIQNSRFGSDFMNLYNGDMSSYKNDHSAADMALCQILAFWTGCDRAQMDRIFRSSALMRAKWDQKRGRDTYGNITIDNAIAGQRDVYTPAKEKITIIENIQKPIESPTEIVEYDDKNDPIIKTKTIFKTYPLTDTGNAERFYDQFGEFFRYNKDNQYFMFWN